MTTIRSGGPRIPTTSSTQSTAPSAPATASNRSAATGASSASSFQAATGSSGGTIREKLDAAKKTLDGVSGDAADKLKKLLDKQIPTNKELNEALEAYDAVAGDLSDDDRKTLEKGIGLQMAGRQLASEFQKQMDKFLEKMKEKPKLEW
ncbi:MAG: hypothetical protein U0228_19765 [Myxococcaceae bacterium]